MLTGMYPPAHGVGQFGAPLPASIPYLPDALRRQGYHTAAFVGSLVLDPKIGTAPGFDRGFDLYDAGFRMRTPGEDRYRTIERRGDEVASRASAWLTSAGREPFFLWVHLFDPHDPYDPPADLKQRFASAPYDGEIASIDRIVDRLVKAAGAGTIVAVAADHGEALGGHGEATHGVFLYDETLHVPLVIRFPAGRGAGARVDARVRLADLAPTLLEAAGLPRPSAMQGESMMRLVRLAPAATSVVSGFPPADLRAGSRADDRPVYAESAYPRQAFGWSPLAAWRADRFLYVRAPTRELYDLVADPAATKNVAGTRAGVADGLEAELAKFLGSGSGGSGGTRIDPAVAERLAALGYVSGSGSGPAAGGIDPKERIAIANTLHDAMIAVEDARFGRAVPLLEQVIAREPDIPIAQLNLGIARARQKQYARAVPPLTRAVALQAGDMRARYELASALYETGDLTSAAGHFAVVASKMPAWADARYSLGSVYARIDRVPDAIAELRAALDLEPRHFRANLLLGRLLTLRGEPSLALPYLRTAVTVQPDSTEAKQFLAEAVAKSR
jgi:arylsulfatase A-like enzyme/Flp pilus assembly protein TadD